MATKSPDLAAALTDTCIPSLVFPLVLKDLTTLLFFKIITWELGTLGIT